MVEKGSGYFSAFKTLSQGVLKFHFIKNASFVHLENAKLLAKRDYLKL